MKGFHFISYPLNRVKCIVITDTQRYPVEYLKLNISICKNIVARIRIKQMVCIPTLEVYLTG